MRLNVVIPARISSTRLPRKLLAQINGKPMLWHVWHRVQAMETPKRVIIATDSQEIAQVARTWGGDVVMTSAECRSGTERIASIVGQLASDWILNVQGDEPLVDPKMLDEMVAECERTDADIVTPVYRITSGKALFDPNIVKVVRAADGCALYFSRNAIPYVRDLAQTEWLKAARFWAHVGVYAYRREVLEGYGTLKSSVLEQAERLEQLRLLEAGYKMQTIVTNYQPTSVDTKKDLERVRGFLRGQS